ncbi:MAG: A/G-specific adenine glycosylase [Bacteroidales bacterium]|nr:A/G-specific adenine glycosylase [Bacteroidales bacterium]
MDFTQIILDWYDAFGRDLPWRHTHDPYAVWLSEIILQQTRIAQGTAYWERFMARFPDVQSLSAASEDEVLRLWEGLGYYSRARNLHAAAKQIAALGAFPRTFEGIRALKGIGDYTAAAIGSIAFGLPAAVVDGNVYRVLGRHFGIDTPIGTTAAAKQFGALAQSLLPQDRPGDFNQGMMDFGAMQCTPKNPVCLTCPLAGNCVALNTGRVSLLPVKKSGPAVTDRYFTYIYLRCQGETAIRRRGSGDIWQGLWEPVLLEHGAGAAPPWPAWTACGTLTELRRGVRHALTHRILHAGFYLFTSDERPALPGDFRWIPEGELDRYAKPRLFETLLEAIF